MRELVAQVEAETAREKRLESEPQVVAEEIARGISRKQLIEVHLFLESVAIETRRDVATSSKVPSQARLDLGRQKMKRDRKIALESCEQTTREERLPSRWHEPTALGDERHVTLAHVVLIDDLSPCRI